MGLALLSVLAIVVACALWAVSRGSAARRDSPGERCDAGDLPVRREPAAPGSAADRGFQAADRAGAAATAVVAGSWAHRRGASRVRCVDRRCSAAHRSLDPTPKVSTFRRACRTGGDLRQDAPGVQAGRAAGRSGSIRPVGGETRRREPAGRAHADCARTGRTMEGGSALTAHGYAGERAHVSAPSTAALMLGVLGCLALFAGRAHRPRHQPNDG